MQKRKEEEKRQGREGVRARMATAEGTATSFLNQFLTSIRIVKVFQAGPALAQIHDAHLAEVTSSSYLACL
jgi:hypothetical protein